MYEIKRWIKISDIKSRGFCPACTKYHYFVHSCQFCTIGIKGLAEGGSAVNRINTHYPKNSTNWYVVQRDSLVQGKGHLNNLIKQGFMRIFKNYIGGFVLLVLY